MFNGDVVNSVLLNNHMNNCTKEFDPNDGAIVLLDFINYVAEVNNYDRVFTIKELFDRAKKQKHKRDLHELKSFLNLSNQYEQRLNNGESINSIYAEMAASHSFIGIREDGAYLYNKRIRDEIGIEEMCLFERNKVEKKLYAICYAYEKSGASKKEPTKNKTIIKILEEMKQR